MSDRVAADQGVLKIGLGLSSCSCDLLAKSGDLSAESADLSAKSCNVSDTLHDLAERYIVSVSRVSAVSSMCSRTFLLRLQ